MAEENIKETIHGKEITIKGRKIYFTSKQVRIGHTFYMVLAVLIIAAVAGLVWAIFDAAYVPGLYAAFVSDNIGFKILIIGVAAFLAFFLLVLFFSLRRKGTDVITKAIFATKRLYEHLKVSALAKFTPGGLIIAILIFGFGAISFVIQLVGTYTSVAVDSDTQSFLQFMNSFSGGEIFLVISILALSTVLLIIFVAWLTNAGTIFFARVFLKIPIDVEPATPKKDDSTDSTAETGEEPEVIE